MTINRHPAEDLLLDYVSGAAAESDRISMAVHLSLCEHCRESVALLEAAAGAIMEDLGPEAQPRAETLEKLLSTITGVDLEPETPGEAGPKPPPSSSAIEQALAVTSTDPRWQPIQRGVSQIILSAGADRMAPVLARLDAGEMVTDGCRPQGISVVLVGELVGRKRRFKRGDVFHGREGIRASSKGYVIYLRGAVPARSGTRSAQI